MNNAPLPGLSNLIVIGPNGDVISAPSSSLTTTTTSRTVTPDPEDSAANSLRLPLSKLRPLVKLDPDVQLSGQDAVYAIGKATEIFIELLATVSELVVYSKLDGLYYRFFLTSIML